MAEAKAEWSQDNDELPPPAPASHCQKVWDLCNVVVTAEMLLEATPTCYAQSRARILAATTKEAGARLYAFPSSSLGLLMDDDTV